MMRGECNELPEHNDDGDTVSFNILDTKESIDEINSLLKSKEYYLSADGDILYGISNDIIDLVLLHMTE